MSSLELKIPPLIVVALFGVMMVAVAWVAEGLVIEVPGLAILGFIIELMGILICVAGVRQFRRLRTTVNPTTPEAATTLATDGIYGYSRNPMYLGFAILLFGWALMTANLLSLLVATLFVFYMNRFQIIPEERALQEKFGVAFEDYRRRVRRWI